MRVLQVTVLDIEGLNDFLDMGSFHWNRTENTIRSLKWDQIFLMLVESVELKKTVKNITANKNQNIAES